MNQDRHRFKGTWAATTLADPGEVPGRLCLEQGRARLMHHW